MKFFFLARKMIFKSTEMMRDVFVLSPIRTVHCFNLFFLHVIWCRSGDIFGILFFSAFHLSSCGKSRWKIFMHLDLYLLSYLHVCHIVF